MDPETEQQLRRDRFLRTLSISGVVVFTVAAAMVGFHSSESGRFTFAFLTGVSALAVGLMALAWLEVCHGESFLTRPRRLERFGPSSPVTPVEDCTGWKVAFLRFDEERIVFQSLIGANYGVSAPALCIRGGFHTPPDPACTCGFWSYRTARSAIRRARREVHYHPGTPVLLHVDLFGDVLEHTRGFRAGEQDVLGVQVPRSCSCGRRGVSMASSPQDRDFLAVCCVRCAPPDALTLSDVASRLGTEVQWSREEV